MDDGLYNSVLGVEQYSNTREFILQESVFYHYFIYSLLIILELKIYLFIFYHVFYLIFMMNIMLIFTMVLIFLLTPIINGLIYQNSNRSLHFWLSLN
jgi:hypothetical protein